MKFLTMSKYIISIFICLIFNYSFSQEEQEEVIDVILNAVEKKEKKLIFYWVPPANGKTLISSLITKMLSERKQKKILLYMNISKTE